MISGRKKYSASDLLVSAKVNETIYREEFADVVPFTVEECQNVSIFLMTALAQCSVDYCSSSFIFIGPCEGPVFIRSCQDCVIVSASQQFRLRDCKNLQISLFCKSQPIIETSSNVEFSCFQYYYPRLFGRVQTYDR